MKVKVNAGLDGLCPLARHYRYNKRTAEDANAGLAIAIAKRFGSREIACHLDCKIAQIIDHGK